MSFQELEKILTTARNKGRGAWQKAIETVERTNPDAPVLLFHKGCLALEEERLTEAVALLEKAQRGKPKEPTYAQQLSEARLRLHAKEIAAENAASPFLQALFGKHWVMDEEASMAKSEQLNAMPQRLSAIVVTLFKGLHLQLYPEALMLDNVMDKDMELSYHIVKEQGNRIQLSGQTENQESYNILLEKEAAHLGFFSEINGQAMQLWMREETAKPEVEMEDLGDLLQAFLGGVGELLGELVSGTEKPEGTALDKQILESLNIALEKALYEEESDVERSNPLLESVEEGPPLRELLFKSWTLDIDMTLAHGLPFSSMPENMHDRVRQQLGNVQLVVSPQRLEITAGGRTSRGNWERIEQSDYHLKVKAYQDGDDAPASFEFSLLPQHLKVKMQKNKDQDTSVFFFER